MLTFFHVMFLVLKLGRKGKCAHLFTFRLYSAHEIYAAFVLFTQLKIQMLSWMTLANCCLLTICFSVQCKVENISHRLYNIQL